MYCCVTGLLEETLGSFYAPSRPLSDVTVLQFRDMISKLSRRFFHHLLRYWSQNNSLWFFSTIWWNSFRRIWIHDNVTVNLKSSEMSWYTCTTKIMYLHVPLIKPGPYHWCNRKHKHVSTLASLCASEDSCDISISISVLLMLMFSEDMVKLLLWFATSKSNRAIGKCSTIKINNDHDKVRQDI